MKTKLVKTITYGPGGWRAEVYTDDDGGSGYGDNALIGYWYGTFEECRVVDPKDVTLYSVKEVFRSETNQPDLFDLACERRWD